MLSKSEARERVTRGAAYLDQARPGWHDRIDVGTLTLHDPCGCIIGQLCGATWGTFSTLGRALFNAPPGFEGMRTLSSYGVDIVMGDGSEGFKRLQDAWIEAIAERRCPVKETTTAPHQPVDVRGTTETAQPVLSIRG